MAGVKKQLDDDSMPSAHGGIYRDGPLKVEIVNINSSVPTSRGNKSSNNINNNRVASTTTSEPQLPPKPLVVAVPREAGEYPVVQFHHGFTLQNHFYSQLMAHIASHGFIVVAPQMYTLSASSDATQEITEAASILNWLPNGLLSSLPNTFSNHKPNFSKLALAGHSRGGKVVFGLALGLHPSDLRYSALIALDPVDGMGVNQQTQPPILTFTESSLKPGVPTLLLGTGLGPIRKNFLFPPCAPEGVSHRAFFSDCGEPVFQFVAEKHGHMDFLNDDCGGAIGKLSSFVCRNGPSRLPMRRFSGGVMVAFLQGVLFGEGKSFEEALRRPELAPVPLEMPKWKGELVAPVLSR